MKQMKSTPTMTVLLTLTSCLLTVDLWTRLMEDRPLGISVAAAQVDPVPKRGVGSTAARAFEQRQEMVKLLKQLNAEVAGLRADLKSGSVRIHAVEKKAE